MMAAETMQFEHDVAYEHDNRRDEFNDKLVESIEEVLNFSQVVLNFLELNTAFKRGEIVNDPGVFSSELEDLFGDSTKGIEELIVERFYSKIKLKFVRSREKTFSDYVNEALNSYI
jgi:hypothetical protein